MTIKCKDGVRYPFQDNTKPLPLDHMQVYHTVLEMTKDNPEGVRATDIRKKSNTESYKFHHILRRLIKDGLIEKITHEEKRKHLYRSIKK